MRLHRFVRTTIVSGATMLALVYHHSPCHRLHAQGTELRVADPRRTPEVEVVEKVKGAVVNIHSERSVTSAPSEEYLNTAPSQNRVNGMGTGIIIDSRGYIITNQHVVDEVNVLRIRFADGNTTNARVVARDPESDLALIKVDVGQPLPVMPLGTASDLMVGEKVVAIGNAYGYPHSVTTGVVSAVKRDVNLNKEISYKSLIQTDASINPGNSGGPLVNIKGELIGVNVAIRAGAQGIGFAIPVDTMIRVAANMMATKKRNPLNHGIVCKDKLETEDEVEGRTPKIKLGEEKPWSPVVRRTLVIERIESSSPAARSGFQVGDTIVQIGEAKTICVLDLEKSLLDKTAGDKVQVLVKRQGKEEKLELTLQQGEKPAVNVTDLVWKKLGVKLSTVEPEVVARVNQQLRGGLAVSEVRPESAAGRAGIQRGDILVGLHQWEMLNPENVAFVLQHPELATFSPVRFYILRGGQVHRGVIQQVE